MNPKKISSRKTRGFTLIEIMVAMGIGAILIGGIIQVFVTLKQTNKVSYALGRLQESARIANDVFTQDGRHIGFFGCIDPFYAASTISVNSTNAPSHITNIADNSLNGWEVSATGWGNADGLGDIDNAGPRNARLNSDVFRAQFLSQTSIPLDSGMALKSSVLALSNNIFGLSGGDMASIGNCESVDIFTVSGTTGAPVTIAHSSAENTSDDLSTAYQTGDLVRILLSNTYFVGDTGRTNINGDAIYSLYRKDVFDNVEEIVEGIENMQILYGQELANNAIRFVNANDASLVNSEITVIKIGLLLASTERVLSSADNNTYRLLDQNIARSGTTITYPNDLRLRRAVNLTINIRNRRQSSGF